MNNPLFSTLVLIGVSCLYLFVVISGFRKSGKQQCSTFWLLLPLCGAAVIGLTLIFSIPALPATPLPSRLLELLAHLINILLIWTIAGKIAPINRLSGTLLYAWNPLVLIELTVYANTAGVVICLLLLAVATPLVGVPPLRTIAVLILVGLAVRINFMALLIAPLLLWFMVRHLRDVAAALLGFAWRVLVVVAVFVVAYIPGWQGDATFLAITSAFHPFDFAYSPLSLLAMPTRALFSFVAQKGHFPPALMEPTQAADMTVLATSFFLFALLYLREMGRVRTRPGIEGARAAQAPPPLLSTTPAPTAAFLTASGRGGRGWDGWWGRLRRPRLPVRRYPLSLQDEEDGGTPSSLVRDKRAGFAQSYAYHTLFTGWTVVILGYIVLAVTVFGPGYVIWVVWIVALRRFDRLSVGALLLSCSALLYYPLQRFAPTTTDIVLPLCIFGIPLVYGVVQRYIFVGRIERKNVLT